MSATLVLALLMAGMAVGVLLLIDGWQKARLRQQSE
jgi:hypothetical protein